MRRAPIDRITRPFGHFMHHEGAGGILLFAASIAALLWANSPWHAAYHHLWELPFSVDVAGHRLERTLHHWINDGLMAMFFFVVGLELKREMVGGELSDPRKALLPVAAGFGGMVAPALIYLLFNPPGTELARGWGVPMATDIAFALGILALLGDKVPAALKVFLATVAIADDLGSVLVIAFFYTEQIGWAYLAIGGGALALLIAANLLGVRSPVFFGVIGIGLLWTAFLLSGVHATIAGVLAALTIPARTRLSEPEFLARLRRLTDRFEGQAPNGLPTLTAEQMGTITAIKQAAAHAETPLQRLEQALHPLVAFVVLPLFALANAGVELPSDLPGAMEGTVFLGVLLGLLIGKPLGILATCWVLVRVRLARMSGGIRWGHLVGMSVLAGVGFTMSLFINELAFRDPDMVQQAKLAILMASLIAGAIGYLWLRSRAEPAPSGGESSERKKAKGTTPH
ncbi:MAG: Na+/H+ antiporter NhaA [Flavobacteriales bacterium]|nr:Na+/H+ antiporter NhaA [Flavobacteriales bacterium]